MYMIAIVLIALLPHKFPSYSLPCMVSINQPISVIEAIDAEKFVSAIQLASSQTVLVSSHSDDQQNSQSCCSSSGFHPHLVIVEGTMLLSIR